jgi:hypothetical protein
MICFELILIKRMWNSFRVSSVHVLGRSSASREVWAPTGHDFVFYWPSWRRSCDAMHDHEPRQRKACHAGNVSTLLQACLMGDTCSLCPQTLWFDF